MTRICVCDSPTLDFTLVESKKRPSLSILDIFFTSLLDAFVHHRVCDQRGDGDGDGDGAGDGDGDMFIHGILDAVEWKLDKFCTMAMAIRVGDGIVLDPIPITAFFRALVEMSC